MITCAIKGGLGNQLFQIFSTISFSIKSGIIFKFLNIKIDAQNDTIRPPYWNSFLNNLTPYLADYFPFKEILWLHEKNFQYKELTIPVSYNQKQLISLNGYFQSYKYFEKHKEVIFRIINLQEIKKKTINKMPDFPFFNSISMHFRLGDYKKYPKIHPILDVQYYINSVAFITTYFPNITHILYFCENEDFEEVFDSIKILKERFPNLVFKRCSPEFEDWEQMVLMSSCLHNIIANSSFSWWGAYFNSFNRKVVCYPTEWFGEDFNEGDTSDLCPPEWVSISSSIDNN